MKLLPVLLAALASSTCASAFAQPPGEAAQARRTAPQQPQIPAARPLSNGDIRDDALRNDRLAYDIVEGLTTEVGPRLAGTEAEARAAPWMAERFRSLGFSNVRIETYDMPVWVRGEERAEVIAPFPQPLAITALGNSGATAARGIEAEVVGYGSMEAFQAAPGGRGARQDRVRQPRHDPEPGRIAIRPVRRRAPRGPHPRLPRGAAAILVRSIGTDYHRNPHTGVQSFAEGVRPIPAGGFGSARCEQLQRVLARAGGRPVRLRR
jgi:hypothetical protein